MKHLPPSPLRDCASDRINILGVPVDQISTEDIATRIDTLFSNGQHLITTPNQEMCVRAYRDLRFRAALAQASLAIPDGIGLIFAARAQGALLYRIPGRGVMPHYFAPIAAAKGLSLYLLGA